MKVKKKILAVLMMAIMVFGLLPVSAQAADNGMVKLSKNTTYTKYDVTGNGKKDTFKFMDDKTRGDVRIYLNGKYVQKIFMARGGWFYLCNGGKNNVYLIKHYFQYGGTSSAAYKYQSNKFEEISTFKEGIITSDTSPLKFSGNILYMKKYGRKGTMTMFPEKEFNFPTPITWIYKYTLKNGKATLMSDYATIGGSKTCEALNSFSTSKSVKLTDQNGPRVKRNDTVILKKWYNNCVQISVNGKTGWVDNSKIRLRTK